MCGARRFISHIGLCATLRRAGDWRTGALAVTLLLSTGRSVAYEWTIETVDGPYNAGTYTSITSIAVDQSNYPHISFFDDTQEQVKYAYKDTGGWHVELVATEVGWFGGHTCLALDTVGTPHISYFDYGNGTIGLAHKIGSSWQAETVDTGLVWGGSTSLTLDATDNPHISYVWYGVGSSDPDLRYARRDSSGWVIQALDTWEIGPFTSIALDADGYPYISYYDDTETYPADVRCCYQDASGWHSEWVCCGDDYSSLALDPSGYPHISFEYVGQWYAYKDASGWHNDMLESSQGSGSYSDIAIDRTGEPHMAYYHGADQNLKYVRDRTLGWHTETVDSATGVGTYTSLVLDANDHPHISYYDDTNGNLKYAYGAPTIDLTASLQGPALVLTWTAYPGAFAYWVYGASNDAHFLPGFAPAYEHRLAVLVPMTLTWSTPAGVGDPDSNWSNLVLPVDAAEQELCRSNRAGEHTFPTSTE